MNILWQLAQKSFNKLNVFRLVQLDSESHASIDNACGKLPDLTKWLKKLTFYTGGSVASTSSNVSILSNTLPL